MKILKQILPKVPRVALLLAAVWLQSCKKDAATVTNNVTAPPNQGMHALINDTAWTAVSISASLTYELGTGKIFTCQGTMGSRVIQLTAIQSNSGPGNSFPVGALNNSSTSLNYYVLPIHRELTEQTTTAGNAAGAHLVITAIDTNNQLISGTFTFPQADSAYDANYNFIFAQYNQIANGTFKQVHYVYTP